MDAPEIFPYRFNRWESGVFVEIYLPKKIRYQGVLYKSLRTGFNFRKVKEHLKSPGKFRAISEFLENYTATTNQTEPANPQCLEELCELYKSGDKYKIQDRVGKIEQTFYGYSMYEVDGVFLTRRNSNNLEQRRNPKSVCIRRKNSGYKINLPSRHRRYINKVECKRSEAM